MGTVWAAEWVFAGRGMALGLGWAISFRVPLGQLLGLGFWTIAICFTWADAGGAGQ